MSKKPLSQKRAQRQQEERAALNNIFTTFLVGLAAECYLFIVYCNYIDAPVDSMLVWYEILKVLAWVGLGALVGGAGLAIAKKKDEKLRRIGVIAALAGAFFAGSGWVMTNFVETGVVAMCAIVPVLTILMLVFFLYQRDCFVNTTLLAGTLFALWVCDRGLDGGWKLFVTIGAVAAIVAVAVIAVAVRRIQFNDGKLGQLQIFAPECDYRMIYLVCGAAALMILLALVLPMLTYYLIWAAVIALFALLAYYTVKLM